MMQGDIGDDLKSRRAGGRDLRYSDGVSRESGLTASAWAESLFARMQGEAATVQKFAPRPVETVDSRSFTVDSIISDENSPLTRMNCD